MNMKQCALSVLFASVMAASVTPALAQNDQLDKSADKLLTLAQPIHIQATIVGVDAANRTLMVRSPRGDSTVVMGKEVTNFDKLRIGDRVDVLYKNALLVSAEKVKGNGERERIDTTSYQPTSGAHGQTGFDATRQVELIATVENVDTKKRTITLRGPWHTETLDLLPEFAADKLKKGDTVHAVFVSATAVDVTPASSTN